MKFKYAIKAFILVCLLVAGYQVQAQTTRTIPTGSFVVNMGVSPQTVGNGLKPYGLVYDLVKNYNVPIYWVINPSKGKDGIDFSHNGVDYKGGPFIIPVEYRSTAVNDRITFWQSQGVVGANTVSSISVPVAETITAAPNWTLDQKNGSIAAGYFTNAGIPSSSYNFKDPALLGSCDDIFVMPHADPTWATHANLLTWNQTFRGAIWAACHAVSALEDMFNPANPAQQTNFLSAKTGTATGSGPYAENALVLWGNHSGGSPPYNYSNPTDPVMQFLGILDAATQNGSEQIYLPKQNWISSTKLSVVDPTQADVPGKSPGPAAVVAYGPAFGDANRGKVMYEAGHSHNKGSAGDVAAQRAFFNFSFWANKDKALQVAAPVIPSNLVGGQTYNVSSSVTASIPSGPYTYQWTSTCGGTFANSTASSTTFTPPAVAGNTSCVVQLKVTDACGRSNTTSSVVVITPGPRPPVTANDAGTIAASCATSGTSLTLNVLANDSDPDGDPLTLTGVTGNNGTWTFNSSTGLVTYQPAANFTGTATATYTVCAPSPNCATGTITVSVGSADVNGCFPGSAFRLNLERTPTAQTNTSVDNPANAFSADYDETDNTTYAVINNNSDVLTLDFGQTYSRPTADSVRIYFAAGTAGSSVTLQASYSTDGTNFTVAGSYSTSNRIDGAEASFVVPVGGIRYLRIVRTAGSANLFIDAGVLEDYTCQSVVPAATNDEVSASEDIPVIINVLDNDESPAGLGLSVRNIVTNPVNGKVSINPDNTITYINNTDYSGTDSFTYRVCDTQGFCSNATVTVTIADDNCVAGQYRPFSATTTSITLTALDDSQIRRDRATNNYGSSTTLEIGKKETNARRGIFIFDLSSIPTGAIIQSANFSITRTGGDGNTLSLSAHRLTESWVENQVTWNIRSTGTNWTTAGGTYNTTAAATISAAGTSGAKTFGITNLVQNWVNGTFQNHGLLVKQSTEVLDKRHQYATSENGTAANRPQLAITYVTLAPCIAIPNRAPLANPDYTTTPSNASVSIPVLANDSEPDAGNTISLNAIVGSVTGGSAVISGNNIVFTPTNTFTGTAVVRYRVSDGTLTDESFAYITVTNVGPVAVNDVASYNSNTNNNSINVLANDLNPDGPNPLTTTILKLPANGTASLSGTNIIYTPNQNYFGRDTIQYQACEPVDPANCAAPACSTAFVYITVNNRPPVAVADVSTTIGCVPKQINVLTNDSDPENGPLTITSATVTTANAGTLTISADKTYIVFSPQQGFIGNATINYTICDNGNPALCSSSTVTVSVNTGTATNGVPLAANDSGEDITRAQIAYIGVLSNDTDPEGTSLTISLPSPNLSPANSGTVALFGTSQVMFTPNAGFLGTATFQYQVCDQSPPVGVGCPALPSQCTTATVTVKVINQAPQPINDNASTGTNIAKNIFPLANDNEPDGDALILQAGGTTLRGGTMVLNNNGTPVNFADDYYVYTPPANFTGQDQYTYTVCDNVASPNNLCSTATIFITIAPPIDLQLTKTFSPATSVTTGSTVTFTLSLFNNSVSPATGVTVRDLLSSSYQFQSSSGTGTYDAATGIWAIGNVAANATLTRTITVTALNTNSLTNTAEVYTANEPDVDSSPNNNNPNEDDRSSVTPPSGADLAITKTDGLTSVAPGSATAYTIVVTNNGPSSVTGATVTDILPASLTNVSWSSTIQGTGSVSTGATGTGNSLAATVNLPAGAGNSVTFTVTGTVAPGATGTLSNTATVAAPGGTTDPTPGNNTATDNTTLTPTADLAITKTDGFTSVAPGNALTYTIVVTNSGPSNVTGATVNDILPASLTNVSWSSVTAGTASVSAGATGTGNSLAATVNLPAGAGNSVTFTVTGTVAPNATGTLTNTATVTAPGGTTDPTPGNNTATDNTTLTPTADLAITKTDGKTATVPGSATAYTIVVTNNGPSSVTGATVNDNLPATLTNVSWSSTIQGTASVTSGATGTGNSLAATVNLPAGAGNSVTFTVTGTVAPGASGTLTNTATVAAPSGTTDPTPGNNTATDNTTLTPTADLGITKTDGKTTYTPGTTVRYTVVVTNAGPSTAVGATITDTPPNGTSISSWSAEFAGGATGTQSGTGSLNQSVTVPSGGTITYTVDLVVPSGYVGALNNTASVMAPAGTTDTDPTNNEAMDSNTQNSVADLAVVKTVNNAMPNVGSNVTFTLTVTNFGPSNATGVILNDTLPSGYQYISDNGGGAYINNTGKWTIGNLASGASVVLQVTAKVNASGNYTNSANVVGSQTDPVAGNNFDSVSTTPVPQSDLSITKSVSNVSPTVGSDVTFTLTVINKGPSNATGVVVEDELPSGYTYVSDNALGAYNSSTGEWTIGNLAVNDTVTLQIVAKVQASGGYLNVATVSGNQQDPNMGNNEASSSSQPLAQADLAILKMVSNMTPDVGTDVVFTLTVSNQGPSTATGVVVTDVLPAGFMYVSDDGAGAYDHTTGKWNVGTLENTENRTLLITATVSPTGSYTNTAMVEANEPDPNIDNNSSTKTPTPIPVSNLAITKTDGSSTYTPGNQVTYTLTVTNAGPSRVVGAQVSDILPGDLINVSWTSSVTGTASVSSGASGNGNSLSALVDINAGVGNAVIFTVTGTARSSATGNLINTAQVTAPVGTKDSFPGNNMATDEDLPSPIADLSISKTDSSTSYTPGTTVDYTLLVSNAGPSDAVNALVTDTVPAGTTITSWTAVFTGGATGTLVGSGNLNETVSVPVGGSILYTVKVAVPSSYTGDLENRASVAPPTGTTDPDETNNLDLDTDVINRVADLRITKTDSTQNYTPGTSTTYTIVVSNAGPSDASNVAVIDNVPNGTTWTYTSTGTGGASGNTANGTGSINDVLTLPAGDSIIYRVEASIPADFSGNLTNTATVSAPSDVTDPVSENNSATDTDLQNSLADLAITITDSTPNYTPGSSTTYVVVVSNAGPSQATGATVIGDAPAGTTITGWTAVFSDGSTGANSSGSGNISETVSLPPNSSITYTVSVAIPANYIGNLTSPVSVSPPANVTDPDLQNNNASDTDTPIRVANLSITKTDNKTSYTPGTTTTYTIEVSNAGPSTAFNAAVIDNIPQGTTWNYTSTGTTGTSGNTPSGNTNIGDLVTIPAGGKITYTVLLTIPPGQAGNLVNMATVNPPAGTTDPNEENNKATDTNTQSSQADLSVTNSDGTATYTPGTTTTYKVVVKNSGPSNAIGARVLNEAPAGTTITGWTAVLGGAAAGTTVGSGTINQIVSIPTGDSITYTVIVSIPSAYSDSLKSTATVEAPAGITDPTPGNNTALDTDAINRVADLSVTKTNGGTVYTPGTTTTYTLVVNNAGPSKVVGATITDNIPAGTTWSFSSTGTAGTSGNTTSGSGTINDQVTIPSGGKITYTVTVTIPANFTGNLSNVAQVTAPVGTTDPNLTNNEATDTDNQNSSADLSITKTVALPRPEPGVNATFTLTATNFGPSNATLVKVTDQLPAGYTHISHSGSGTYNNTTGEWTIGNLALNDTATLQIVATVNAAGPYENKATIVGHEPDPIMTNNESSVGVELRYLLPKVYLQGALFGITYSNAPTNTIIDSLMRDDLRVANLIPTTSPYGYWNPTSKDSMTTTGVLATTGRDAIVDWVFVELRNANDSTTVVSSRPALLQRDGDIVNLDGTSPLDYRPASGATYFVAVRHRNHLGVMTQHPVALTASGFVVDFRNPLTPTFRKNSSSIHKAQVDVLQGQAMWAGSALRDNQIIYQGMSNDVNVVSQQVVNAAGNLGQVPFYILSGYHSGDIDLNGKVIFQSSNNDVEYIYQNIIKNHPGNAQKDRFFVIQQQLPD